MKILVVGAGAIGGYFGGRLLEAKRNVTFLVREKRAEQLRRTGLSIKGKGKSEDLHIPDPPIVLAGQLRGAFDLVLLSCKSFDLEDAIAALRPAVGNGTRILPLLNGMRHLDVLQSALGADPVLGGRCFISTTLDQEGRIFHLDDNRALSFGERSGMRSESSQRILAALSGAGFDAQLSANILQDMWDKWIFIAAAAGITCLMRAPIGDIVQVGGTRLPLAMLEECLQVARSSGMSTSEEIKDQARRFLTTPGSAFAASMLRDIERGGRTEVENILGDLIARRGRDTGSPGLLDIAYAQVKAYEIRRARGG